MSTKIFGTLGLALMALGIQLPAEAQTTKAPTAAAQPAALQPTEMQAPILDAQTEVTAEPTLPTVPVAPLESVPIEAVAPTPTEAEPIEAAGWTGSESLTAEALTPEPATLESTDLEADELTYPVTPESQELAQARRRTRNTVRGSDFLGVGADFGYADDVSFAVISKLSLSPQVALRPSVLVGDDLSILVPVTYDLSSYSGDVAGFRFLPYAGVGASYQDGDGEDFNLLLTAGTDIPLSQQFTLNAQANVGVLNDTNFGVTVGVGYNFGNLFR